MRMKTDEVFNKIVNNSKTERDSIIGQIYPFEEKQFPQNEKMKYSV